jgi:hypothetical protein
MPQGSEVECINRNLSPSSSIWEMVFYLPAWQLSSIPQSLLVDAIDKSGDAEK